MAVWELPQNVLGAALFALLRLRGGIAGVDVEDGRLIIEAPGVGISLGSFVYYNAEANRYYAADPLMRRHEIGHTFQSRWLGPLYLPLVGVPSTARALYSVVYREVTGRRWTGYFDGYPESWADRLGGITREERLRSRASVNHELS